MKCIDCGLEVSHYEEAELWLKREVLVADDLLDADCNGETCPATEENHRVAA